MDIQTPPNADLGFTIQSLVKARGMTLEQAALAAGIPWATFHRFVTSKPGDFRISHLSALARALGVTVRDLVGEDAA